MFKLVKKACYQRHLAGFLIGYAVLGMEVLGYNALYFNQLALFGMELEEY
jgi:hypothetical protein